MSEKAIVTVRMTKTGECVDLEIPLHISANELCSVLLQLYVPNHAVDVQNYSLKAERPIALLRGERTLKEYGIRNGSIINVTN